MTKDEKESIDEAIEIDGFDYAMTSYSDWEEIDDDRFQELLRSFIEARQELADYLGADA
jgi:hypothetical protein